MKKTIALLLAFTTVLCLALAGCGQADDEPEANAVEQSSAADNAGGTDQSAEKSYAEQAEEDLKNTSNSSQNENTNSAAYGDTYGSKITYYDDGLWTLELLGKETNKKISGQDDASYIVRIRNNSSIPLKVTLGGTVNGEAGAADIWLVNKEDDSFELAQMLLPVGSDAVYDLLFDAPGEKVLSINDLKNVEINFNIWNLTPEGALDDVLGEYKNTRFDWSE